MTERALSTYFSLNRRYYRSVNLVRDLDKPESVQGYVPTERSADALRRILGALGHPKAHRAWTITGVYGTGKSAFAHYLLSLCADEKSPVRGEAVAIAEAAFSPDSPELAAIKTQIPAQGVLRAATTGQREPLSCSIARALIAAAERVWGKQKKPDFWPQLTDWEVELVSRKPNISPQEVLHVLKKIVATAQMPMLLVVDELGKALEYAAHHQGVQDLYLLQQIAELDIPGEHQVYFLGLLHQSFAGYSERLAAVEQSEWTKIQGRFEDIPFAESPSQMTRLIGRAIDRTQADPILYAIRQNATDWFEALAPVLAPQDIAAEVLAAAYPLHPLTALVLPLICTRYAQNDRSLFTFLTSEEPYGLQEFMATAQVEGEKIPTLKLYQLYDYFVESVPGLSSRINLQRWVEVQGLIEDARDRPPETIQLLKTIGILNLVTTTGDLRATPQLVALALCDSPDDEALENWHTAIQALQQRSLITYRSQLQELRIWQGSDFNVEAAIYERMEQERNPIADLLANAYPLKQVIPQRHYTTTGTLRYFEQRYGDSRLNLNELTCSSGEYDGLILYWLDRTALEMVPAKTLDGKPLVVVEVAERDVLATRAQALQVIKKIWKTAPELQNDGVARREVKQRLTDAERLLDETVRQTFDWASRQNRCWMEGALRPLLNARAFQSALSAVCDRAYPQTPILDNELINRRVLTSQGAKARRELIEAMLERADQPRLGLTGYGPEVAMYSSVLEAGGIHRQEGGQWGVYPPLEGAGILPLWEAVEAFCLEAQDKQLSLGDLYRRLEQPPYGIKQGMIPVVLAAVLLHHADDVSFYKDGTFVPVMGPEHFELLVKDPSRFSVKHIDVTGVRGQVFRELEAILRGGVTKPSGPAGTRNLTVLSVVKPLIQFVRKLPAYTLKTRRMGDRAYAVLQTLRHTQEPDTLLFHALPAACGLDPIVVSEADDGSTARLFRERLVVALREINLAYDTLLNECQDLLYSAFGVQSDRAKLRADLQFRAGRLLGNCVEASLNRFARAAADEGKRDRPWLEAVVMVIADKPAESWSDEDVTRFELSLSDLSRRFKNLEALQAAVKATSKGGFEARRVTVTRPDGTEINQMVWVDHEHQAKVDPFIDQLLQQCPDPQLQQALLTRLTERLFDEADESASKAEPSLHPAAKTRT